MGAIGIEHEHEKQSTHPVHEVSGSAYLSAHQTLDPCVSFSLRSLSFLC